MTLHNYTLDEDIQTYPKDSRKKMYKILTKERHFSDEEASSLIKQMKDMQETKGDGEWIQICEGPNGPMPEDDIDIWDLCIDDKNFE